MSSFIFKLRKQILFLAVERHIIRDDQDSDCRRQSDDEPSALSFHRYLIRLTQNDLFGLLRYETFVLSTLQWPVRRLRLPCANVGSQAFGVSMANPDRGYHGYAPPTTFLEHRELSLAYGSPLIPESLGCIRVA